MGISFPPIFPETPRPSVPPSVRGRPHAARDAAPPPAGRLLCCLAGPACQPISTVCAPALPGSSLFFRRHRRCVTLHTDGCGRGSPRRASLGREPPPRRRRQQRCPAWLQAAPALALCRLCVCAPPPTPSIVKILSRRAAQQPGGAWSAARRRAPPRPARAPPAPPALLHQLLSLPAPACARPTATATAPALPHRDHAQHSQPHPLPLLPPSRGYSRCWRCCWYSWRCGRRQRRLPPPPAATT